MIRWSAVIQHLATRRIVAEVPVESAQASAILNAPGSLTVAIPLDVRGLTATDVEERRNAVVLRRDDAVVASGIIETLSANTATNSLTLGCLGWAEYLRHLHLRTDLTCIAFDQASIVAELVAAANAKSGALEFDVVATPTGRLRDRQWMGWERHSIGRLIEDLAGVADGFNFRCDTVRDADGYRPRLVTSYPASGRPTQIVLQAGHNIELLTVSGSGGSIATDVEMIGAGNASDAPLASASDIDVLGSSPLWEAVESHADVTQLSTLQEKADRRLDLGRAPIRLPKVRLGLDGDPELGSYEVGDLVRVVVDGLLRVDGSFLVTQLDLNVSRDGEYVDMTLAPWVAP